MTVQLDVANLALAHLAAGRPIAAMNEATAAARVLTQYYGQARDEALRDFNWPFARKFAALAQVAAAPTPDWGFSYRYPADCLFVRDVYVGSRRPLTATGRIPYIVGQDVTGRLIYASTAALQIEYTVAISEAFWPPDFVSAVSFLLAWYAAPTLTGGDPNKLGERARAAYQEVVQRAQFSGENEQEEELTIANLALTHLGISRPMMSMGEQSQVARAVRQFYPQVINEVLREFNWPAARKFAALTLVAGDVSRASLDFQYSYRYPADCLFAREVLIQSRRPQTRSTRVPFVIGQDGSGLLIFTDAAPIAATSTTVALPQLEYTVLIGESSFPALLTQAVALLLASYVAPVVMAGDKAKAGIGERARQGYEWAIARARNAARNEQEDDDEPESSFILARS